MEEFIKIINSTVISNNDFITKLKDQNLWSYNYTLNVIEEYKKFIYLGLKQEVSPSFEIDQVWHLHILYTNDYNNMCKKLNINFFHHNPTDKNDKKIVTKNNYTETKELYSKIFKKSPPIDIWTNWKYTKYIYLDLNIHWVIPAGDWKALIKLLIKFLKQ